MKDKEKIPGLMTSLKGLEMKLVSIDGRKRVRKRREKDYSPDFFL